MWIRWMIRMAQEERFGATCHKQESRHTRILRHAFRIQYFGAIWSSLNKDDCSFLSNKIKRSYLLWHTACRVHLESVLHEDQGSASSKGKRDSKTACCSQSWFAMWFTRYICARSKTILGIATRCGELREIRSNTADYRAPRIAISTVKLQDARRQNNVTKLIEVFENIMHKEQFFKDIGQKQEINRFGEESQNCSMTWAKQRSSKFSKNL